MVRRLMVALWSISIVPVVPLTALIRAPLPTDHHLSLHAYRISSENSRGDGFGGNARSRGRRQMIDAMGDTQSDNASDEGEECTRSIAVRSALLNILAGTGLAASTLSPSAGIAAVRSTATTAEPDITNKCFIEATLPGKWSQELLDSLSKFPIRIMERLTEANNYSSANAYRGKLVFGLYGKACPKATKNFLRYVMADRLRDEPSYAGGVLTKMSPGILIEGGKIAGLNPISIGGREELEYQGEVIESPLLLESTSADLKHNRRGLLTRPKLAIGPEFAVTLGPAPDLDGTYEVFGRLLQGDDVLRRLERVPVYSLGSSRLEKGSVADKAFRAQNRALLYLGKNVFKDTRAVDRTGSFMRRIDIFSCGQA